MISAVEILPDVSVEFRKMARDHRDVEAPKDRLLGFSIEEKQEARSEDLLCWAPRADAMEYLLGDGHTMPGLALSILDGHVKTYAIAMNLDQALVRQD